MKKGICIALSVLLLFGLFASVSSAGEIVASGSCGDGLTWTLTDAGVLTVDGSGDMEDYLFYLNTNTGQRKEAPWYTLASDITSVIISTGVTRIGNQAFCDCRAIRDVSVADTVTEIGSGAFGYCESLTEIVIPDSVTAIKANAFCYCSALTDVTLSARLTEIGGHAFDHCVRLERIGEIPSGIVNLENGVFISCSALSDIVLPSTLNAIGDQAFEGCAALSDIVLPASLTKIGMRAFAGSGLTSVTIPGNVQTVGMSAFQECNSLETATFENGLKSIGNWMFYFCEALQEPIFPSSITSIGDHAFWGCHSFRNVSLPEGLKTIGEQAFCCRNIESISLPDSLTTIGNEAFYPGKYSSIGIPAGVRTIGRNAFGVHSLREITVAEENPYFCSEDGILYNKAKTKLVQFPILKSSGVSVFTVPNGVTTIGDNAFANCYFQQIILPSSLTRIESRAFYNCDSLRSLNVPDGVKTMGEEAFALSNALQSVRLPASLTGIGANAFQYCYQFSTVDFAGARCQWDRIAIDAANTELNNAAVTCLSDHVPTQTRNEIAAASCTMAGEYEVTETCTVCGEVLGRTTEEIPMTPHVLVQHEGKAPTTSAPGWKPYETCENCAYTTFEEIPRLLPDPYETLTFSFTDGILTVSGTGAVPTVGNAADAPFASYAEACRVIEISDGITNVQANAFAGLEHVVMLILDGPAAFDADAFATNPNLQTVVCADAVRYADPCFAEGSRVTVYEPKNAPHTGTLSPACTVLPYSFADGTLYVEGSAGMDVYSLLDLMAVFCSFFDDVHFVRFDSYTSYDVPFYVYDRSVKDYVPAEDNTLTGVSFSVKIPDGADWAVISFNEFCELAASDRLGAFRLVADLEVGEIPGEDPGEQPGDQPEEGAVRESIFEIIANSIQNGARKVLKWIVGLLNFMFNILSKFKK